MSENRDKRKLPLNRYREFFSQPKSIKIYVPDNKSGEDGDIYSNSGWLQKKFRKFINRIVVDNPTSEEDFVGRTILLEKLFKWLTDKKNGKGSYLVTGYRGMGKTSLVNLALNRIIRDMKPGWELVCFVSLFFLALSSFAHLFYMYGYSREVAWISLALSVLMLIAVLLNKYCFRIRKFKRWLFFPWSSMFRKERINMMANNPDDSWKSYRNIKIGINLGHEVINERDILCLIATNIKEKYSEFLRYMQHRFSYVYIMTAMLCAITCVSYNETRDFIKENHNFTEFRTETSDHNLYRNSKHIGNVESSGTWFSRLMYNIYVTAENVCDNSKDGKDGFMKVVAKVLILTALFFILRYIFQKIELLIPMYSTHRKMKKRLDNLADRLNSSVDENAGSGANFDKGFVNITLLGNKKRKTSPTATVREIEAELIDIVNRISGDIKMYRIHFHIVFDELDKIDPDIVESKSDNYPPEYTDSIEGFPMGAETRDRRKNVLNLLANIKLFISTANAKFIFISGRELYDAYLADLSDRDFAISSIFSGVINVDSFLSPEGGQADVRSMTELYVANRLIPKYYLRNKEHEYAQKKVLKKEIPSLRWYYEYLMDLEKKKTKRWHTVDIERQKDIECVIVFLRGFAAYLSHISNGSPKKIFLYFDKYLKNASAAIELNDWDDVITVGDEVGDKHSVLFFTPRQQNCINFIHYLSGPIMSTITNDMSSFGDRYLVSLSFVIDHIYKHHSRSFSWRDLEQTPELLKTNKAPELRKSVSSIMEFLTQIHISPIVIGFNEYKFHKSIAEEIDYMSKISDEASALFNFTLDESLAVIRHNTMLLNHYIQLMKSGKNCESTEGISDEYKPVIARIHSVMGDLHFGDEDYYKATLEYKLALNFNGNGSGALLTLIRINLKLGLTYEYRKMYPNAYYVYSQLVCNLVKLRNIDETEFGLDIAKENVNDWRYQKYVYVKSNIYNGYQYWHPNTFEKKFLYRNLDNDDNGDTGIYYYHGIDGVISNFSSDLTPQKAELVAKLTLFEEIRYFHQVVLAKLFVVEKMVVSGITQTNIDVAESEFEMLFRTTNIEEKFIVAADFFCKLADILYYKNSLTIFSKNSNALATTLYFEDFNVYAHLDSYCYSLGGKQSSEARLIKNDVKFFFENVVIGNDDKKPCFDFESSDSDIYTLFKKLSDKDKIDSYYKKFINSKLIDEKYANESKERVKGYLEHCKSVYKDNKKDNKHKECFEWLKGVETCFEHREKCRASNLRPPCYSCKYYNRSLEIMLENLIAGIEDKDNLDYPSKSVYILLNSYKSVLRYTRVNQVVALAKTLEGMGNVMLSCASFDKYEGKIYKKVGISPNVIQLIIDIVNNPGKENETEVIRNCFKNNKLMTRLDRCIVYYWDAYRFYLIISQYDDAINCLGKIMTLLSYYIGILNYSERNHAVWQNEQETVRRIIGDSYSDEKSFVNVVFKLMLRHTGFQYDNSNLTEIHDFKWLLNKDGYENIDLTKLSGYPNVRATVLRLLEINIEGRHYIDTYSNDKYESHGKYCDSIINTYKIVSPSRRNVITSYEEILGYYVKMLYNERIINEMFGGNQLLDDRYNYDKKYHVKVYLAIHDYLEQDLNNKTIIKNIFHVSNDCSDKLELLEFVIQDSLMCLTDMVRVFTPHNHLTSYSKSFIAMTYNRLWEWSRYYELLYNIYDYKSHSETGDDFTKEAIVNSIAGGIIINEEEGETRNDIKRILKSTMNRLCCLIPSQPDIEHKYGDRCARLYSRLKHDLDDVAINLVFSNYSAQMALNYYCMAEEASTEGDAYKDLINNLFFLNDDLNNDTCQFNLACERFLLNCDVVKNQKQKLHYMYSKSNVYASKSYTDGPENVWKETERQNHNRFGRSEYINSEY